MFGDKGKRKLIKIQRQGEGKVDKDSETRGRGS